MRSDGRRLNISQVRPFSNQSGQVIFLMLKGLEALGILPKVHKKVWGIFQTVEVRDRQKNTNTVLAIVHKIVKIPGDRIT